MILGDMQLHQAKHRESNRMEKDETVEDGAA